jgi:tRNA(Ile)-lysidine synthase
MTGLIAKVRMSIKRYLMLKGGEKVIIAVSGGPDSVCLLHLLLDLKDEYRLNLIVAHVNHGLRGKESMRDEAFVTAMAKEHFLPLRIKRISPGKYKNMKGTSLQEKARVLRYACFNELLEKEKAEKIALGHNADDQAETLLAWLIRGAGTRGLSGIPAVREDIFIRPLIEVEREEIEQFLKQRDIEWILDSSNLENKYLRNRIRSKLIPHLKETYNPNLVETLTQTSNILRAEDDYLQKVSEKYLKSCLLSRGTGVAFFDCRKLLSLPRAIQLRILREGIIIIQGSLRQIAYKHLISILQLLGKSGSSKGLPLPGGVKVTKEYDRLIMRTGRQVINPFCYHLPHIPESIPIQEINKEMKFTILKMNKRFSFSTDRNIVYLDRSKVTFPVTVRNWTSGDWFYPRGMRGRKKVKDFFIDKKIPFSERRKIPLLLFGDRIAWVGGLRSDQEMAATQRTKEILKVELTSLSD